MMNDPDFVELNGRACKETTWQRSRPGLTFTSDDEFVSTPQDVVHQGVGRQQQQQQREVNQWQISSTMCEFLQRSRES